ncbi:MAG: aminomethyl-transferring glycine dehydrogenase [Bacteroidetes bacterium]|nr:aminomethyl-transferring glycine dehydrogenase [Bacteroidota bacterium]
MKLFTGQTDHFVNRHNGSVTAEDINAMLNIIGQPSVDELINKTVPSGIRMQGEMNIKPAISEQALLKQLKKVASKNKIFKTHIGMGYYNCFTPGVILRNIMENPGWYTQYTPYQAEIAQGRLEALLNYQTMIIDLTGLPIANASLLDEGTGAAEAMAMFRSAHKNDAATKFFVDKNTFPQTIDILKTRSTPMGIELVFGDYNNIELNNEFFGAYVQYPNSEGSIENYKTFATKAHSVGVYVCAGSDLMALSMLTPPGEWGADCVVGNSQRFGVPLGYGGPHAGFFATKDEFKRIIPGRIIGVSIDRHGNKALRMALQTREQHIRRQNATSNICTAQVLLSIMAGMFGVYHGPSGIKNIANRIHGLTKTLDAALASIGFKQFNSNYFDTLLIDAQNLTSDIKLAAEKAELNFHYFENGQIGIAIDETNDVNDIFNIVNCFAIASNKSIDSATVQNLANIQELTWPAEIVRVSNFMTHPVFNNYHSEHEMLRYIKQLESKDLSLCHSMISLGSCTMKLNATTEMIPVTWPEFNQIHPFAPLNQVEGYSEIIKELAEDLQVITGFEGMSLQPNSGAQGEYAGLMVIRAYLQDKGEGHRNVALIPESAHGTNPASAAMAGMQIVIVKNLQNGNIDIDDLKVKANQYKDSLAVFMVTYPSTYGVYEANIKEITSVIHENGGQVYMDGANMNAQVGLTSPGLIGADVCHLNLHKTFCIPHGGGGPGMGPIGVAAHLIPFLPGHSVVKIGGEKSITAISAAPYGSASILLISYIYIKLMGAKGLKSATEIAILNANYIKSRLETHYPILYKGDNGTCAHEMILDTRSLKTSAGVEAEDLAKRLMDYGYHAPTLSFPVAGTLMIEPTESESKIELDRFCDTLIAIRNEVSEIENGTADREDNVLKNSPHTATEIISDAWAHKYSREKAAYPSASVVAKKFWPSVARVNSAHGDRNLICACLPIETYFTETSADN